MSGECVFDLVDNTVASCIAAPQETTKGVDRKPYNVKKVPPPTASTFGIQGTSAVLANGGGEYTIPSVHPAKKTTGSFGREVGPTVYPANFLRKNEGPMTASRGAATVNDMKFKKSEYHREKLRPDIPNRYDRPVMGLKTDKDYVVANAVENIMAIPTKQIPPPQNGPTDRKDFGQVPEYLKEIKEEINTRRQTVETHNKEVRAANERWSQMTDAELTELRNGLQCRWDVVNRDYQSKGISNFQTPSQKQKQEALERELCALEFAMQKLSRRVVFVYDDKK